MSITPSLPKIGFYCSSISWGGLEMNSVRYAQALQQENFEIQLYGVEGTSFFQSATELGLPIQAVPRNKKYFDFMHARSLAKIFQKDGIEIVHFRDNRDLDFLGWVNFFSFRKIKLVYHLKIVIVKISGGSILMEPPSFNKNVLVLNGKKVGSINN